MKNKLYLHRNGCLYECVYVRYFTVYMHMYAFIVFNLYVYIIVQR